MKILPLAFALMTATSPTKPDPCKVLRQLYGEWLIVHSNHPQFHGSNSRSLGIYPKKKLVLSWPKYFGPVLCSIQLKGEFRIICNDEENCNIEDTDAICTIDINWNEKKTIIQSIFGIGVNEWEKTVIPSVLTSNTNVSLNILEPNNIYLSTPEYHTHLVRNTQLDTPVPNNTPLSTFFVTQALGIIVYNMLHNNFKNIF